MIPRLFALLLCAAILPACGLGGVSAGSPAPTDTVGNGDGGDAHVDAPGAGNTAVAGRGGSVEFESAVQLSFGTLPPPVEPAAPAAPTTGTVVTSAMLTGTSYTQATGNILLQGDVAVPAGAGTYSITATLGDIVVTGTLSTPNRTLSLGAGGSVFVSGTVRTGRTDGVQNGASAGGLGIICKHLCLSGGLEARGEDATDGTAGNGGAVTLRAVVHGGRVDASGGAASGAVGPNVGGNGGTVTLDSDLYGLSIRSDGGEARDGTNPKGGDGGRIVTENEDIYVAGSTFSVRGGPASTSGAGARGGLGGEILLDNYDHFEVFAVAHFAGGPASAGSGAVVGGNGGRYHVGSSFTSPGVFGAAAWSLRGGSSNRQGGQGGSAIFTTQNGYLTLRGTNLDLSGGASGATFAGGRGGTLTVTADRDDDIVIVSGTVLANGGPSSGTGAGGMGGAMTLSSQGDLHVEGSFILNGGDSAQGVGGAAVQTNLGANGRQGDGLSMVGTLEAVGGRGDVGGGAGGVLSLYSGFRDQFISGTLRVDGGAATGAGVGGPGGGVGIIAYFEDTGGDLTILGILSADGGAGSLGGGSARNNGGPGVGYPSYGFYNPQLAIQIVSTDFTVHLEDGDVFLNAVVTARGGGPGGAGGDVAIGGEGIFPFTVLPAGSSNAGGGGAPDGDTVLN